MNNFQFKRSDRVSQEIKDIISNVLSNKVTLPDSGLITITKVKTSDNLRFSRIYLSFIGNTLSAEELISSINKNLNEYRYNLGKSLQIKYVPQIKFYHDDSLEQIEHIATIINKTKDVSK